MTVDQILKKEARSMNTEVELIDSATLGDGEVTIVLYHHSGAVDDRLGVMHSHRVACYAGEKALFGAISKTWWEK